MAGLVPTIPIMEARALPDRYRRVTPGDAVCECVDLIGKCFSLQSEFPRLPVSTIDARCPSTRLIIRYFGGDAGVNAWGWRYELFKAEKSCHRDRPGRGSG